TPLLEQRCCARGATTPLLEQRRCARGATTPLLKQRCSARGVTTSLLTQRCSARGATTPLLEQRRCARGATTPLLEQRRCARGATTPLLEQRCCARGSAPSGLSRGGPNVGSRRRALERNRLPPATRALGSHADLRIDSCCALRYQHGALVAGPLACEKGIRFESGAVLAAVRGNEHRPEALPRMVRGGKRR